MVREAVHLEEVPERLREHANALGCMPRHSLFAFIGLGLSDSEIGRYFKIPESSVMALKAI